MESFAFDLDAQVQLAMSGEEGVILGRAEMRGKPNQYLVRYKSADGRLVEGWWDEDALGMS